MKKIFNRFVFLGIVITFASCVSDDLPVEGDLEDFTGPTPFFNFTNMTSAEFNCEEVELSVDYDILFTAGSNLAVNGTQYFWSVEPAEGVSLINSQTPILERLMNAELVTVLELEEDIVDLQTRIPCEEDPARVEVFMTQITDLEMQLEEARAALTDEALQNIADLENQLAILPPATLEDQELIFNFPSPGSYTVSLTVMDNLGKSNITTSEVVVVQAIPRIPVPEIQEAGFEDGSLFDGTGDGRDSWRSPSIAAWSPNGGGTTVLQINGNSEEGTVPEGLQAAKMPADGGRVLYQEIEVTPGAEYVLTYFVEFDAAALGDQTVSILAPNTSSYAESLLPENILGSRTDNNSSTIDGIFQQRSISFAAGENESVIIYATNTGVETRMDAFAITVRQ